MSDKNTVRNKKADDIFLKTKIQPLNSKIVFLPTSTIMYLMLRN